VFSKFVVVLSSGPPIPSSTKFTCNDQEYVLNAGTLEKLDVLGQGAHGIVQKMQNKPSGAVMAVKVTETYFVTVEHLREKILESV